MANDPLLYAVRDGRQLGRFSRDKLDTLLWSGQLKPNDSYGSKGGLDGLPWRRSLNTLVLNELPQNSQRSQDRRASGEQYRSQRRS